MSQIKAVTFDLWDTLIQEVPGGSKLVSDLRVKRIASVLTARGLIRSSAEVEAAYKKSGEHLDSLWSHDKDAPAKDHVMFVLTAIDPELPQSLASSDLLKIERVYVEGILEKPPVLLSGAARALETVRAKWRPVGLVSNTGRTPGSMLRTVLADLGILSFFDDTIFSDEVGERKPSTKMFETILGRMGIDPSAAVHVGDDPDRDVVGAKRTGMRALQVLRPGVKRSELADGYVDSVAGVAAHIERM